MDEPALLPKKGASQKCAEPNFDYLREKHSGSGNSAFSCMYEEYVSACERAGMLPYVWRTFKRIERKNAKIRAQQQLNPGEYLCCAERRLPKNQEYDESGKHRNLFVAISLYSEYCFACAHEGSMATYMPYELWMRCCTRAYRYFEGVHRATLCSNIQGLARNKKATPPLYTLHAFASHYKTVCFYPRGEGGRQEYFAIYKDSDISRFINGYLKESPHLSTEELNRLISELMDEFNGGINSRGNIRREDFLSHELPILSPLPDEDYDMSKWCERSVRSDYHFKHNHVYYSVPYQYARETVLVRVSDDAIEAFSGGKLIASHRLCAEDDGRRVITDPSHRPEPHKAMAGYLTGYFMKRARQIGSATAVIMKDLCSVCKTNGGSYRICKDLLDLQSTPSELTLEEACREVLREGMDITVQSVSCMMKHVEKKNDSV